MTDGLGAARLRNELTAAWAICKKDVLIYYLRPSIIVSGLLFPLFMFLAFAVGRPLGAEIIIPGLISITLLFSASSIEPVSIPIERRMRTFDRLVSAPISLNAVVLGESLSGFLYALGIALVPLVAGMLLLDGTIVSALPLLVGALLTSFCFATMGTLSAAYHTESPGDIMSILNLVRFPLIFISGVFVSIAELPEAARWIAYLSPLTYGNDLIQSAFTGRSNIDPLIDVAALAAFTLVFQIAADWLYKRNIE